jgi:hypothetical protein
MRFWNALSSLFLWAGGGGGGGGGRGYVLPAVMGPLWKIKANIPRQPESHYYLALSLLSLTES